MWLRWLGLIILVPVVCVGCFLIEFKKQENEAIRYLNAWENEISKERVSEFKNSDSEKIIQQLKALLPAVEKIETSSSRLSSSLIDSLTHLKTRRSLYFSTIHAADITVTWSLRNLIFHTMLSVPFLLTWIGLLFVCLIVFSLKSQWALQKQKIEMESNKEKALGKLAAHVAHDIRGPLTALKMLIHMKSHRSGEASEQDLQEFDLLSSALGRIESIASDLLENRKTSESVRKLTDVINQLVSEFTVRCPDHSFGISPLKNELELEMSHKVTTELQRILSNLIQNAVDVTPPGQKISIFLEETPEKLTLKGRLAPLLKITVQDQGAGFSADILKGIQDKKFGTDKINGHGLGLRGAFVYLEQVGGRLEVRSSSQGSQVSVLLPQRKS